MKTWLQRLFSLDPWFYFALLCSVTLVITYLSQRLLLNETVYWNSFGHQLTLSKIQYLMTEQRKWIWVIYLFIPLAYLVKTSMVTLCLLTGAIFFDIRASFYNLFRVTMIAEGVFLIPAIIKVYWFSKFESSYGLADIKNFSPWSLTGILGDRQSPAPILIAGQSLDAFEVLYWFVLAYGIYLVSGRSYGSSLKLVLSSYGVGLIIWILLLIFFELSVS